MKRFLVVFSLIVFAGLTAFGQDGGGVGEFLKEHWLALLIGVLAFAEVITRLTPTKRDDTILEWIKQIIGVIFPNRKVGGGSFRSHTNK